MTISASLPGLRILPADISPAAGAKPPSKTTGSFGQTLQDAVGEVDDLQQEAQYQVSGMLQGNGVDVHDAMIAVEKADLSFQLMLQMRNKVVQAYQQIAGMQF